MNIEVLYVLTRHFTKGAYRHTRLFFHFFFLQCCLFFMMSHYVLFYDVLFISATRNYPENVLKPQVLLLHKIHVWHIDGGHITQEVQYKQLRETPHSDASKHPNTNKSSNLSLNSFLLQLLYIQPHMSKDLE